MKIAFRGHKSRGKEIIQIFKDLGTEDLTDHTGSCIDWVYFRDDSLRDKQLIVSTDITFLKGYGYKIYTLEEFEKEFPFKIGDEVTITGLPDFPKVITKMAWDCDEILYSFEGLNNTWFGAKSLKKFEMKEERNITLTLDKAKEWYKKGGELKEIALQAFTEQELNPLPRSWEEFCEEYPVKKGECILESKDVITVVPCDCRGNRIYKNWIPSKKSAEAHLAMIQLEQLRDCYNNNSDAWGWSYSILKINGVPELVRDCKFNTFLRFKNETIAKIFLKNFKPLIEQAGDLI